MKPNSVGSKVLYLNPSSDALDTTALAAIDGTTDFVDFNPYAYTATVRSDYDSFNFHTTNSGSSLLNTGRRLAVGLFLSAENDKRNFIFQVSGAAKVYGSATALKMHTGFFFGRKATNNTVVSDKANVANTLAKVIHLPSTSRSVLAQSTTDYMVQDAIQTEVFSLELSGGFVYCFGFYIDNHSAADLTLRGGVSLAIRKYTSELMHHTPSTV